MIYLTQQLFILVFILILTCIILGIFYIFLAIIHKWFPNKRYSRSPIEQILDILYQSENTNTRINEQDNDWYSDLELKAEENKQTILQLVHEFNTFIDDIYKENSMEKDSLKSMLLSKIKEIQEITNGDANLQIIEILKELNDKLLTEAIKQLIQEIDNI